jgi:hypothetical protein
LTDARSLRSLTPTHSSADIVIPYLPFEKAFEPLVAWARTELGHKTPLCWSLRDRDDFKELNETASSGRRRAAEPGGVFCLANPTGAILYRIRPRDATVIRTARSRPCPLRGREGSGHSFCVSYCDGHGTHAGRMQFKFQIAPCQASCFSSEDYSTGVCAPLVSAPPRVVREQ